MSRTEMLLYKKVLAALVFACAVHCNSQNLTMATQNVTDAGRREVIYLLTLLPYFNPIPALNPSWTGGNDVQPALDLAMDQINSNPGILENYTLQLVHGRDGCDVATETALGFVKHAFSFGKPGYTGVIGPGCSSSTTLLSKITETLSLVVLHGGGSPSLSNRTLHSHLLGVLGSTVNFVEGFNNLISKSQWERMALLYDDSRLYFLATKELFVKNLPADISLLFKPVSFTFLPLDIIREQLIRIVLVMCPVELTQRIMCLAMKNGMIYQNYQFVIMSHTKQEIAKPVTFTYDQVKYDCSKADMERALDMMLLLTYNLVPAEGEQIVSDITFVEYLNSYGDYRELYNQRAFLLRNSTYAIWSTFYYDSLWAWALVLDNLTKSDSNFTINAEYGNVDQSRLIVEQFYQTSFQGMSGEISFRRETGYTPRKVNISQISETIQHHVATIDSDRHLILEGDRGLEFIDDSFHNETLRESRGLAIFFNIASAIQISIVVFVHIVTIIYSKKPSIKATSPKLLHMSYAGVYVLLLGTFLWTLNPAAAIGVDRRPIFCNLLWTWCLPIGFTLIFCPVAMRTWRIYRIFKHYLNPGKFISDPFLIGCVVGFLVIDLIIAVTWTAVDFYVTTTTVYVIPNNGQTSVIGVKMDCTCDYSPVWLGVIFSYKVCTLFAVTLFAFLTRKIANRSFATSSLRILVFLLAIVMPLGFSVYFMVIFFNLDGPMNYFSFTTLCILLNGIGALCVVCIFIPPLIPIFKKYKKKVMVTVTSNSKLIISSKSSL